MERDVNEDFVFPDTHVTRDVEENGTLYREAVTPPICDFCFDKRVRWSYSCATFVVELGTMVGTDATWGSTGGWAACDACSAYIEAGDEAGLIRRAALSKVEAHGRPKRIAFIEAALICRGFLAHRDGEREAFG